MPTALSKDFHITLSDLDFIHQQVTAPRIMIIGYDIQGNPIYGLIWSDTSGISHTESLGYAGTFDPLGIINPLTGNPLFPSTRVADGLRETSVY